MDFKKVSRESQVLQGNVQQDENVQVQSVHEPLGGEQQEQPADRLLNQKLEEPNLSRFSQGAQDGAFGQVKGRYTWSGTSVTGEKKKAALKNEKKEVQKDQRFDKFRRQAKKAMQPKNYRTLYEILSDIMEKETLSGILSPLQRLEATVENSDSGTFTDMVSKTRSVVELFERCYGQASHDYQEAFVEAKKAVDLYLQEHKGHRWSGKGKERKKYAKELKAQFDALEIPLCKMMLEAKATEMGDCENNSTYADMANAAQFSILDQTPNINEYTDKRVEELVKNGTMSAKMKALFEMRIFNEYQISHKGLLEENGRSFDQKQLKQKMDAIMDSINKSSLMEQLNAIDEIVSMQTVLVHQLMDNYASYIHEAPAGTDAYAYAVLKLKGSPLVSQQEALVSMMRSMGNTAGTDAASQVREFAQKRIEGAYPDQVLLKRVFTDVFKNPQKEFIMAVGGDTYKKLSREQMKQEADRLLACNLVSKDKKTRNRQTVNVDKYVEKKQNQIIFNSMNDQFCKNIKMDEPNIDVLGKYEPFLGLSEHRMERVLKNGTLEDRVNMLYNLSVDSKLKYQYDDFKKKLLKSVLSEEGAGKHELAKILFRLDAGIRKHMLQPTEEDDRFHIDGSYRKMSIILYANMVKMLKENGAGDVVQVADGFMAEYAKTDEELMKIEYSNINPGDVRIAAENLGLSQSSKVDIDGLLRRCSKSSLIMNSESLSRVKQLLGQAARFQKMKEDGNRIANPDAKEYDAYVKVWYELYFETERIKMPKNKFPDDVRAVAGDLYDEVEKIIRDMNGEDMGYMSDWADHVRKDIWAQEDIDDVTDSILSEKIDEQKLSQWEKEANEGSTTGLLKQFFATELVQSRLNMKLQFGAKLYGMEEEKEAEASRKLIGKLQGKREVIYQKMALKSKKEWDVILGSAHAIADAWIDQGYVRYQEFLKEAPEGMDARTYARIRLKQSVEGDKLEFIQTVMEQRLPSDIQVSREYMINYEMQKAAYRKLPLLREMMSDVGTAVKLAKKMPENVKQQLKGKLSEERAALVKDFPTMLEWEEVRKNHPF